VLGIKKLVREMDISTPEDYREIMAGIDEELTFGHYVEEIGSSASYHGCVLGLIAFSK
jgi:hypothetical protein